MKVWCSFIHENRNNAAQFCENHVDKSIKPLILFTKINLPKI